VYSFGSLGTDGSADLKSLLGGKGANLAEMTRLDVPVPPGFTITTEVCGWYARDRASTLKTLQPFVDRALKRLGEEMGQAFGDSNSPLLVSVRSGAAVSMPGMMDTVLNVGLNSETRQGLIERAGNDDAAQRTTFDCELRLLEMFGTVVDQVPEAVFSELRSAALEAEGVGRVDQLSISGLKELLEAFHTVYAATAKKPFPEDPREQLERAIEAVFSSWNSSRAQTYRRLHRIADDLGTAVNVQAMVFGNAGPRSATGVCFTRNPSTGTPEFFGEFLINAQGEEVVAGTRTPLPMEPGPTTKPGTTFAEVFPEAYRELLNVRNRLETHYGDVQDIEFTVENDQLHILQTRRGQRTGVAAIRIATDFVDEGLIEPRTAIDRVDPIALGQLLAPVLTAESRATASDRWVARGLPAGPGGASGRIALDAESAIKMAETTEDPVILVRMETSPEDIAGMAIADGILTARGGATSHAAVVARGLGKPCVVGCETLRVRARARAIEFGSSTLAEGDTLSLDGSTGDVFRGSIETADSEILRVIDGNLDRDQSTTYTRFTRLLNWADEKRTMGVRANADTPEDALRARAFGAEGIGLCRTEHMFFGEERIRTFRQMILARSEEGRCGALEMLLPWQRQDFVEILSAMDGLPVTVRLLDPPLHEFLPHGTQEIERFAREAGLSVEEVEARVEETSESNPMLGTRGCRLGLLFPEIIEMQARAIFQAAQQLKSAGGDPHPEIMIPLVGITEEALRTRAIIDRVAEETASDDSPIEYRVGTMIEIPRAALIADRLAKGLDFFSFGTNDLTQMTFGFSRDDTAALLNQYAESGVLAEDPFVTIDRTGVGALIQIATERGRASNPELKVGLCGEHGGDPKSISFCRELGLDYVSASPLRIPGARLAAAQAEPTS